MFVDGAAQEELACRIDVELALLDERIDWLSALSPSNTERQWREFEASDFTSNPTLEYAPIHIDLDETERKANALPVAQVKVPELQALLGEKQREICAQIELLRLRETEGALFASHELFGGIDPALTQKAESILKNAPVEKQRSREWVAIEEIVAVAQKRVDDYREVAPDLRTRILVREDIDASMVVSKGELHILSTLRVPRESLEPLLAHEIGTHIVTHHNGRKQRLHLLRVGLAHYDALQEGLATLSEYVTGYLSPTRLRVLAARVIASNMVSERHVFRDIFNRLTALSVPPHDAFATAVRAVRGGGLTKDALYLHGLDQLLNHLREGRDIRPLYAGKFALKHVPLLTELREKGWVRPPAILPFYLQDATGLKRLDAAIATPLHQLFQESPGL